jgi:peptide deformylase
VSARKIVLLGDPVLRKRAEPVEDFGRDLRALAQDLLDTLEKAEGVGLAAPQIGVSRRVLVVAPPEEPDTPRSSPRIYVNPEVLESEGTPVSAEEGCLSIPGIYEVVKRPGRVRIRSIDLEARPSEEWVEGIEARILQHEIDHLDGVLFIDKIGPMRRALLQKKLRALLE